MKPIRAAAAATRCLFLLSTIAVLRVPNFLAPDSLSAADLALALWTMLGALSVARSVRHATWALGIALCSTPLLGADALVFWLCGWLLAATLLGLVRPEVEEKLTPNHSAALQALSLMLLALLGPTLVTLLFGLDVELAASYLRANGLLAALSALHTESADVVIPALRYTLRYGTAVLLFGQLARWSKQEVLRRSLVQGLAAGALLAAGCFILQFVNVHPFFSATRSTFWIFTKRYSASFSDPNSFGIMAGVLVPLLSSAAVGRATYARKTAHFVAAAALFVAGLWSGSRSFWILITFCAVAATGKRSLRCAAVVLGVVGVVAVAAGAPTVNVWLQSLFTSPAPTRLLATLHWQHLHEVLHTRLVFWELAFALWQLAPIGGLGLGSFYHSQEYAASLVGTDLGTWRDNANNFYLQLLAEGGLVSLGLFTCGSLLLATAVVDVRSDSRLDAVRGIAAVLLLAFALLLLLGPHSDFDEVRYLLVCCCLLASTETSKPRRLWSYGRVGLSLAAVATAAFYVVHFHQGPPVARGMYKIEQQGSERYRWTSAAASFGLCRKASSITVAAPRPDLPLSLKIYRSEARGEQLLTELQLTEPTPVTYALETSRQLPEILRLEVSHTWQPAATKKQGDTRLLGVQLFWTEEMCERIAAAR